MTPLIVGFAVNGWNVYRALRREGLRPLAIDDDRGSIFWRCRGADLLYARKLNGPDLIRTLNSLESTGREYVLISALEETVNTLNRHRDELEPHIHLHFPERSTVEMLLDKRLFYETARSNGFRIYPMYFVGDDWRLEGHRNGVQFPCIIKKKTKIYVPGVAKAYRVASMHELEERLEQISRYPGIRPTDLVIQEWVPGGDTEVIFCMQYYDSAANPLMSFTGKKIRQWRPQTGGTSAAAAVDAPDALAETTRFFRAVGMHGLCSMEFKRSLADGKLYMIEPTVCRADYQESTAVSNGYNLLYAMYCAAVGRALPAANPPRRPVIWVNVGDDFKSARQYMAEGRLSWFGWWKSLRGPKCYAIFAWEDPWPFVELIRRKFRNRWNRLWKRK